MTKGKARSMLQNHINRMTEIDGYFILPITDEVVYSEVDGNLTLNQYTWSYLIKIAYE